MNDQKSMNERASNRKSRLNTMTKKEDLLSFEEGHVRISLRMVTPFDRDKRIYSDPFPNKMFHVDGKYVRMPLDSRLLHDLGGFMTEMGDDIEGMEFPENSDKDVVSARKRLAACVEVVP